MGIVRSARLRAAEGAREGRPGGHAAAAVQPLARFRVGP
jgi:hypothetical protein